MNAKEVCCILVSIALAGAIWIGLDGPYIPSHCADGWDSPSIGKQGACSHHGGVVSGGRRTPWFVPPLAIGSGFLAFMAIATSFRLFQTRDSGPFTDPVSKLIQTCIDERRPVAFTYRKKHKGPERRIVTPQELRMLYPGSYSSRCMVGVCHRSRESRTFILSRMSGVSVAEKEAIP